MRYTVEQRTFVVQKYFSNNENINGVGLLFAQQYGIVPPRKESMLAMIAKFNQYGTVQDRIKGVSGRSVEATGPENVRRVREEFMNYPRQSISRASQVLNISTASIHRILKKQLMYKPYKTQKRHLIPQRSEVPRVLHSGSLLDAVNNNPNFLGNIWFSDEAHFELVPTLNKQNDRYWSPVQPYITIERPLHPEKTTAWGAICANEIFITFFDETVRSENYMKMLDDEFIPFLIRKGILETSYFMQDGATPHTSNDALDYLNYYFEDRIVSRRYVERFGYGLSWPPYSPDLTPCDFFLWGYLKDRVYANRPKSIDDLKRNILNETNNIPQDMLGRMMNNFRKRLYAVRAAGGRTIEGTPYIS